MARTNTNLVVNGKTVILSGDLLNKIENYGLDEGFVELVEYVEENYGEHLTFDEAATLFEPRIDVGSDDFSLEEKQVINYLMELTGIDPVFDVGIDRIVKRARHGVCDSVEDHRVPVLVEFEHRLIGFLLAEFRLVFHLIGSVRERLQIDKQISAGCVVVAYRQRRRRFEADVLS